MAKTPRQIRIDDLRSVRAVATITGVCPMTILRYEACPDHVKTPAKRWVLDRWYADTAALHEANAQRRAAAEIGDVPDQDSAQESGCDVAA